MAKNPKKPGPVAKLVKKISRSGRERPEPTQDEIDLVQYVGKCVQENVAFRTGKYDGGDNLEVEWARANRLFLGDNHGTAHRVSGNQEGHKLYYDLAGKRGGGAGGGVSMNLTQNSSVSAVQSVTHEPMVVRYEAMETGDDPTYFLSREGGASMMEILGEMREAVDTDVADALARVGDDPAPEDEEAIEQLRSEGEAEIANTAPVLLDDEQMVNPIDPALGPARPLTPAQAAEVEALIEQGVLRPEDLIAINDDTLRSVAQKAWDYLWNKAGGEEKIVRNELGCNIQGNAAIMMQWHTEGPRRHSFTLHNQPLMDLYLDPHNESLDDADFTHFDMHLPRDRAAAEYPELDEDDLDEAVRKSGRAAKERSGGAKDRHYERETVLVRMAWLRHQEVPLSPREAEELGLVRSSPMEKEGQAIVDPDTGMVKRVYVLAGEALTDDERAANQQIQVEPQTDVGHGTRWPNGTGIRHAIMLPSINRVLLDVRCPFCDLPWGLNVNIPRSDGSPYGQGECARLESIQYQIETLAKIITFYANRYKYPQMFVPTTLFRQMMAGGFSPFLTPGMLKPIPDKAYEKIISIGGFDKMVQKPPSLPEGLIRLLEMFFQKHDILSGNSPAVQGRTPHSSASGELVRELQNAASAVFGFRAKWTEFMMMRLARLGLDAAVKWMPEARWLRIASGYTGSAMREILRRLDTAEFDIVVEIAVGRGAVRREEQGRAMQMHQAGVLPDEDLLTAMGDPHPEKTIEKKNKELAAKAAAQTAAMPGGPGVPGMPGVPALPPGQPPTPPAAAA